jgi:hypothetical protein
MMISAVEGRALHMTGEEVPRELPAGKWLDVVGNRSTWRSHRHFNVLAERLPILSASSADRRLKHA